VRCPSPNAQGTRDSNHVSGKSLLGIAATPIAQSAIQLEAPTPNLPFRTNCTSVVLTRRNSNDFGIFIDLFGYRITGNEIRKQHWDARRKIPVITIPIPS